MRACLKTFMHLPMLSPMVCVCVCVCVGSMCGGVCVWGVCVCGGGGICGPFFNANFQSNAPADKSKLIYRVWLDDSRANMQ